MVALLARTFSSGCAALTGVEAISNGVPAFKKPKSKNAATTLLLLGTIAITMLIGVVTLANLTGVKIIDAGRSHYTLDGRASRCQRGDGHRPAVEAGLQQLRAGLLLHHHRHDDHLVPRGEHRVQRLPGARLDPGPGRLSAAPAAHPRRPAGLQQRHRRADLLRRGADPGLQRRGHLADPALRGRGLRVLHGQPARHAPALDPAAEDREEGGRTPPDGPVPGDQRGRSDHDRHRAW